MVNNIFNSNDQTKIEALYKKTNPGEEFEVVMFNYNQNVEVLKMDEYLRTLEYIKYRHVHNKQPLVNSTSLDISYNDSNKDSFRITINDLPIINNIMESIHDRHNHVIFSMLVGISQNKDSLIYQNISLIGKKRNDANIVNIDDYNVRFKLATEREITKKEIQILETLTHHQQSQIVFRYKQRTSLCILNDDTGIINIELTNTKMSGDINALEKTPPTYELEIDCNIKKHNSKHLPLIYKEIETLLKVIHQSNNLISTSTKRSVLDFYSDIIGLNKEQFTSLSIRKPESIEVQHLIEKLPNRYSVTDKADGQRYNLIIHNNMAYLISDILTVINTGITVPDNSYNGTILDGEYIFIRTENRYIFLVFDCIYYNNIHSRTIPSFIERITIAEKIINAVFNPTKSNYFFKRYDGEYVSDKVGKFYQSEIKKFIDGLNKSLKVNKGQLLILPKMFIPVSGVYANEIFQYAALLWKSMQQNADVKCPYVLDGLMFHPLNQEYIVTKDTKLIEYKWKPQDKNSIDFYIEFEADKSGKEYVVYDNSNKKEIANKPYKICHLFVGKIDKGNEQPVPFLQEIGKGTAYLFLENGEVRDIEGNIIKGGTVVEFSYNNDPTINDKYRWVPLRTRYDKTEHVIRYGRRYGNYFTVANKVWRSISNPVLLSDFIKLSIESTFSSNIDTLRSRVDNNIILTEQQENAYYQLTTNIGKPMRAYNNWMKSILIYTNCNPLYEEKKKKNILDIGIGRGGDIMKYYYNNSTNFLIGVDKDNNGLIAPTQGAISRYENLKKMHANFPFMGFINADASLVLSIDEQLPKNPSMTKANIELISKFLIKKNGTILYDRISCQFAIHYFFETDLTWSNFITNINGLLAPGGMLLITVFDADRIIDLLSDKNKYTATYNTANGEQQTLFEIVKKYSDDQLKNIKTSGTGVAIDFFNSMYLVDGDYITEYLVNKDFITSEFKTRCNLDLVETDLFENQYHIHHSYLQNYAKYEENPKTRKFLLDALGFYNHKDELTKVSYELMRLYRYYVFRKPDVTGDKATARTNVASRKAGKVKINDVVVNTIPSKKRITNPYEGDVDTIDFTER